MVLLLSYSQIIPVVALSFSILPLVENLFNVIPRQMFSIYFSTQQDNNRQVNTLLNDFITLLKIELSFTLSGSVYSDL